MTPWTAACQASLSLTISWSLPKFMSIESMMSSNHLILYIPFFFFNFYFYFILLYNTVLVLPYIDMNPPRVFWIISIYFKFTEYFITDLQLYYMEFLRFFYLFIHYENIEFTLFNIVKITALQYLSTLPQHLGNFGICLH